MNTPSCKASLVNFFGDVHTEVFTLKTNHRDKVLGVGCSNGEVKVYDIYEGNILSIGHSSRLNDFPCTSFRWKPRSTNHYVVCNCDGTIKWYNREEETPYGHHESQDRAYLCSDYQVGEEWAIFGTDHNTIEVFDNETMKLTHVLLQPSRPTKPADPQNSPPTTTPTGSTASSACPATPASSSAGAGTPLSKSGTAASGAVRSARSAAPPSPRTVST